MPSSSSTLLTGPSSPPTFSKASFEHSRPNTNHINPLKPYRSHKIILLRAYLNSNSTINRKKHLDESPPACKPTLKMRLKTLMGTPNPIKELFDEPFKPIPKRPIRVKVEKDYPVFRNLDHNDSKILGTHLPAKMGDVRGSQKLFQGGPEAPFSGRR